MCYRLLTIKWCVCCVRVGVLNVYRDITHIVAIDCWSQYNYTYTEHSEQMEINSFIMLDDMWTICHERTNSPSKRFSAHICSEFSYNVVFVHLDVCLSTTISMLGRRSEHSEKCVLYLNNCMLLHHLHNCIFHPSWCPFVIDVSLNQNNHQSSPSTTKTHTHINSLGDGVNYPLLHMDEDVESLLGGGSEDTSNGGGVEGVDDAVGSKHSHESHRKQRNGSLLGHSGGVVVDLSSDSDDNVTDGWTDERFAAKYIPDRVHVAFTVHFYCLEKQYP